MSDKTLSTTSFITLSQLKHPDLYTYEHTHYTDRQTPVIITCPVHGHFAITPEEHLKGAGCLDCFVDSFSNKKTPGLTFNQKPPAFQMLKGVVYVMEDCRGRVKIGIARHTEKRKTRDRLASILKAIRQQPKCDPDLQTLKIVTEFQSKHYTLADAHKAEQSAHRFFEPYRIKLPKFDGSTEFFNITSEDARRFLLSLGLQEVS